MTFLELQNFVLSDRFDESKRAEIKRHLNTRYGRIWAQEPWTFKLGFEDFSVTQGTQTAALSSLTRVHDFKDTSTSPSYLDVHPLRPEDYQEFRSSQSGVPYAYTVIANTIRFDRPMDQNRTFTAMGELAFDELVADGDVPLLPTEFHGTIAYGAISDALRLENDPSWASAEQDYQQGIADMRRSYLTQISNMIDHAPSWP